MAEELKFSTSHPYRLIITIIRADTKGRILERLARGTCVAYKNLGEAGTAIDEFLTLASGIPSTFGTYGGIFVVSEEDGTIYLPTPLRG